MNESNFQEISFLYARTTSKNASGSIGEIDASKNATINVTDLICLVLESELIVSSTRVSNFMNYLRRVPSAKSLLGLRRARPVSSLPARIIPCDSWPRNILGARLVTNGNCLLSKSSG